MNIAFQTLIQVIKERLEEIPTPLRQVDVERQVIIFCMAEALRQMELIPVSAWKPPLSTRQSLDLVGVQPGGEVPKIEMAILADPLVELPRVRSLEWVDCPTKIYITFSPRLDKIKPTLLFLGESHIHLNIY